jgi:hypothetical protein
VQRERARVLKGCESIPAGRQVNGTQATELYRYFGTKLNVLRTRVTLHPDLLGHHKCHAVDSEAPWRPGMVS